MVDESGKFMGRLRPVVAELWFPRGPSLATVVRRVTGDERLSHPYAFEIEFTFESGAIDPRELLGVDCELVLDRNGLGRGVYGVVGEVEFGLELDADTGEERVRVVVVPALALLGHDVDTRFYAGMSVIEILTELLGAGLADYGRELDAKTHVLDEYPRRDYCVRLRESTLGFCERLMQEEGIGYRFEADAEAERERLVLFDQSEGYPHVELLNPEPIPVAPNQKQELERESLSQLDWLARPVPNRVVARAYNLKHPQPIEQATVTSEGEGPIVREVVGDGDRRTIIDDPIDDPKAETFDGTQLGQCERAARLTLERLDVGAGAGRGQGNVIGFMPGAVFEPGEGVADAEQGAAYLLTQVHHELLRGNYFNRFECIPSAQPFRPARTRPRPSVQGVLTGVVVGPEGEEVHTDALGRVRVRFHLDRHGQEREPSSCWVRVAQVWAGPGYGAMVIPRVGMEVVVSFVDGNPDCPLITGCVYNGANALPHKLPGELTRTSFKSASSPGGEGFNELRIDDASGSEQIFVHGQRRMDLRVRGSLFETAGGAREEVVGGDHNTLVRGDLNHHVLGTVYEKLDGPRFTIAEQDTTEHFKTQRFVVVEQLSQLNANEVAMEARERIEHRSKDIRLIASANTEILGAEKLVLESHRRLDLRVGESFISLGPGGVNISGPLVRINSGGRAESVGDQHAASAAPSATVLEPWDARAADDGKPGGGGKGRGGGRRERNSYDMDVPEAPFVPIQDARASELRPNDEDYILKDDDVLLDGLEWVDEEVWCGEYAKLAIDPAPGSEPGRAGLWLVDAFDGSTLAGGIGFDVRDSIHPTPIYDILPRAVPSGRERERLIHGSALGRRTPTPLRVRFLAKLPESTCSIGGQLFRVWVSDYTVHIRGRLEYLRGWMYSIIDVSDVVPSVTPGRIGRKIDGKTDWWYAKEVGEQWWFWNGGEWLRVPKSFCNPHGVNRYGMAVWREYPGVKTQYGKLPWPDPLPAPRPESDVRAALRKWAQGISSHWSNRYQLKRKQCGSAYEPECCRLDVRFEVDWVETSFRRGRTVIVADTMARANDHAWPLDESSRTAAHEFGHLMGLPDEYEGASSVDRSVNGDGAVNGIDKWGLMGSGDRIRFRHYEPARELLEQAVAEQLGKQWTFEVVSKP